MTTDQQGRQRKVDSTRSVSSRKLQCFCLLERRTSQCLLFILMPSPYMYKVKILYLEFIRPRLVFFVRSKATFRCSQCHANECTRPVRLFRLISISLCQTIRPQTAAVAPEADCASHILHDAMQNRLVLAPGLSSGSSSRPARVGVRTATGRTCL